MIIDHNHYRSMHFFFREYTAASSRSPSMTGIKGETAVFAR